MKITVFLFVCFLLMFSCTNKKNMNEAIDSPQSNTAIKNFTIENYNFIIWLTNDIELANQLWHDHNPALFSTGVTEIERLDSITPFIMFCSDKSENINIDMVIKLKRPDNTYFEMYDGQSINMFNEFIVKNNYYKTMRNPMFRSTENSALGNYTFYIELKVNDHSVFETDMEFELTENGG